MEVRESERQSGLFLEQARPPSTARWALEGNRMTIGRDPAADVFIDDKRTSWYHADLIRQGLAWLIVDAASTNGTFVNGSRVYEATAVRPYDRIRVGDTELVVRQLARDRGPLAGQAGSPGALSVRAWNRATKVILGAGALATAIAAVLALAVRFLPSPAHENVARFLSVQPLSQLPLNQYQQSSAVFGTQPPGRRGHGVALAAAVTGQSASAQADPADQPTPSASVATPLPTISPQPSPTVSPTGTPTPAPTASPGGTASPATVSPTPTGSPTGSQAGPILFPPPPGMSPAGESRIGTELVRVVAGEDPGLDLGHCAECSERLLHVGALDANGHNRPLQRAAATIASVLRDSQSVLAAAGPGTGGRSKRVPLGELVSVNMELAGLQGQPVFLSWSIFQENGRTRLFGNWLNSFVAYRLEATTEDDTGTLEMWIPLPKPPGPYFVRVSLSTDGASLTSMDSGPFN
jgi:hypothetical protein